MSEILGFTTLLFIARWAFAGLIYLALFVVVFAVRRELLLQARGGPAAGRPTPALAPGRLRVLAAGSDRALRPGQLLPLGLENTLGADPASDIVLRDQFVSAHHARLAWDGAAWWVEDLGAKNGVQLNGAPVYPHRPARLAAGDRLSLGDIRLELRDD
ncbi:MAG: FHA domain-containing protein [Chloroflexota bacterium]